jgi:putative sterol carrier protein
VTLDELYAKMTEKSKTASVPAELKASILLDISGARPRLWLAKLDGGKLSLSEGAPASPPSLEVKTDEATLLKVAQGQASPVGAFMTGKVKLSGDQSLIGQLKNILPD